MFGHLFFFRLSDKFGLPLPSGQTNLIQMIIVFRVVGVAFDMNGSWLAITKGKKNEYKDKLKEKTGLERDDDFLEIIQPNVMDLFHYTFNYIGLLTGNFYILCTYVISITRKSYCIDGIIILCYWFLR